MLCNHYDFVFQLSIFRWMFHVLLSFQHRSVNKYLVRLKYNYLRNSYCSLRWIVLLLSFLTKLFSLIVSEWFCSRFFKKIQRTAVWAGYLVTRFSKHLWWRFGKGKDVITVNSFLLVPFRAPFSSTSTIDAVFSIAFNFDIEFGFQMVMSNVWHK